MLSPEVNATGMQIVRPMLQRLHLLQVTTLALLLRSQQSLKSYQQSQSTQELLASTKQLLMQKQRVPIW